MRTRTNIIINNQQNFANHVKNIYQAGGIAVICTDSERAQQIMQSFSCVDYKLFFYQPSTILIKPIPDFVRFAICIGTDAIKSVSKLNKECSFVYYAEDINLQYFLPVPHLRYAEFVYFDSDVVNINNTKVVAQSYVTALTAMTELIVVAYYQSAMPFIDKGMLGIITAIKELLTIGCDKDKYIENSLRYTKMSIDYLVESGVFAHYVHNVQSLYKKGVANQFLAVYFINMMLLLFTNWDFNDILIPAENLIIEVPCANSFGLDSKLLLTKEQLHNIAYKVRGLITLPSIDYLAMFSALQNAVDKNTPLFAGINNRGILKGLSGYG